MDTRPVRYNRYPLRDGLNFQIRTRLRSNRPVVWSNAHIGGGQYRLYIQNDNMNNKKQWWTFDYRTKTIRSAHDRRYVISPQRNQRAIQNANAVARIYRNEFWQRIHWKGGNRRNIQNNGFGLSGRTRGCLDVRGAQDRHNNYLIWHKCHNGANQAWFVDQKPKHPFKYPPYPIGDRKRFQIKSRMSGNRALFWREHIGGNQFRVRIQDNNPASSNQWWAFDTRTRTVRAWTRRSYVLSGRQGHGLRRGIMVVIRTYRGETAQKIVWYNRSRQNVKFYNKFCLDVHGAVNRHLRHTIMWNCHNGLNQAWYVDQTAYTYPRQPLPDSRRF